MIPGTLYFVYDILGYVLMALSTLFIAMTLHPKDKGDKWMKVLLIIHGGFFPVGIIIPTTSIFSSADSSTAGGCLLIGWCIYFAPIMILAARYFAKRTV